MTGAADYIPNSALDNLSPFAIGRALRWLEEAGWVRAPDRDGWVRPTT